mmetsp:Transcript_27519/g.64508  ORF Transcript_27519/g.64508 Transcript_27519/m.64508 type:complete len:84 (+) Transcript_27519:1536-1787(+)
MVGGWVAIDRSIGVIRSGGGGVRYRYYCIGLDRIECDWIRLNTIGLGWIGLDGIGLGWVGLGCWIRQRTRRRKKTSKTGWIVS